MVSDQTPVNANASYFTSNFAGTLLCDFSDVCWIVDSGASSRVYSKKELLTNAHIATRNSVVFFA